MRSPFKIASAMALGAALLVSACSGDNGTSADPATDPGATTSAPAESSAITIADDGTVTFNEDVTIRVNDKPTQDREEDLAFWEHSMERFNEKYPNVTIEALEQVYDPQAFQAQLTGGNLPTQMVVPFTEPRNLGAQGQVADVTDDLERLGLLDQLNPELRRYAEVDGRMFAIPYQSYAQGLAFNREMMTEAGLDPDAPPATWDEVRTAAKAIKDATGEAGFGIPTANNYGGWMFTTMCYSFGGTVQSEDGSEVTVNNPECTKALQLLKDMRWTDESMGANSVYPDDQLMQDFAAGRVGMLMSTPGSAYWQGVLTNAMDAEALGVGPMPQDGGTHGTLGGGAVSIISPDATEAERIAAILWTQTYYLDRYLNEEEAAAAAKAEFDADLPVGLPDIIPTNSENAEEYQSWIEPYVNVPQENYTAYIDSEVSTTVLAEPPNRTQEVYAEMDSVVQQILSDENADPQQLLDEVAERIQTQLDR